MIYDIVDMTYWRTKTDILKELKSKGVEINERSFRKFVENINKLYTNHEINEFIAHSNKGYKVTTNYEEIKSSAFDHRKRGLDQLVKSSNILKALGENCNLKLSIKNGELIYTEY